MTKTDKTIAGSEMSLTRRNALLGAAATVAAVKAAFPAGAHAAGMGPEVAKARLGFIALTDSAPVISLPEGSEVRIIQDTGPWIYALIPGNMVGWIHHTSVEKNWPIPAQNSK